jgi:hypothetical protein
VRVLVACEESGVVREAFRKRGHDAYSCDLIRSSDGSPYHIVDDVVSVLGNGWDLMVGHPPCTYLSNSGVWCLHRHDQSERWTKLELASEFFYTLWNAPIEKIVLENPVPHKYGKLPPYTQTIQPYMFGDDASKRTCLWIKGLTKLTVPDKHLWVSPRIVDGKKRWANQTDSGQNRLPPSADRAKLRSKTYPGIAEALAQQYG